MTLHAAIEQVLKDTRRPMSAREIADIVNQRRLYERKDRTPVPANQISARVARYSALFVRTDAGISLA